MDYELHIRSQFLILWTMNRSWAQVVVISKSDYKQKVNAVLAGILISKFFTLQFDCVNHKVLPDTVLPSFYLCTVHEHMQSISHYKSMNKLTILRFFVIPIPVKINSISTDTDAGIGGTLICLKFLLFFLMRKEKELHLDSFHPFLASFDCFKRHTVPEFYMLLKKHKYPFNSSPCKLHRSAATIRCFCEQICKQSFEKVFSFLICW